MTRYHGIAKVVCMIRTQMRNSECEMVKLSNGVKLTPWHPVFIDNTWKFPNNIGKLKLYGGVDYIYNAVVDKGHSLMINGVHCVTLGHHLKENKVVEHPYFGTDLVFFDTICFCTKKVFSTNFFGTIKKGIFSTKIRF